MSPDWPRPPDAATELLALRLIATLGTTNPDGTPHLTPLWFLHDDGRIFLPTGSTSRKARNVQARPAVSVLIDQRQPARHQWVSVVGTAEVVGGEAAATLNARVRARYVNAAGEATYGRLIDAYDDVTLVVTPTRWRFWTPTALHRLAADHGLHPDQVGRWFEHWDI